MIPMPTRGAEASRTIAYFSMEVGVEAAMPTYAGGLGVLAGDTLKAAADLGVPVAGVTLVHRKGYFRQRLDQEGNQTEWSGEWKPEERLEALEPRVTVEIEGREVQLRAWRLELAGRAGGAVPVYLLDADLPDNAPEDRRLTDDLYGGDDRYRLIQEAILGLGGVAMLRALGHHGISTFHMNEGHSALLALALAEEGVAAEEVREWCVFTTHTPVPAGHDRFPLDQVRDVLGESRAVALESLGAVADGALDMTRLALATSRWVNGVAMRHGQVSRTMFPDVPVGSITNGVHAGTWVSPPIARLFDRRVPGWREDTFHLRFAGEIPLPELAAAHLEAKRALFRDVEKRSGRRLDESALTLGFARRATSYKRAALLFSDVERLRAIAREAGRVQVLYAGKAHPRDEGGKAGIRSVFAAAAALGEDVPVVWLEDYDMSLAASLCAGVDVWLNTPIKPREASGTSGMKAALNGVPSLSVPDGWWVEGLVEGVTGWSIDDGGGEGDPDAEIASLYSKLEGSVLPLFHGDRDGWGRIMRSTIAVNGSFFHAQRMVLEYTAHAWGIAASAGSPAREAAGRL